MNKQVILVSWGGVGDAIMCTPAIRELKESNPDLRIILYYVRKSHHEVFKDNPYIDSLRNLKPASMWKYPYHLFAYLFNRKLVNYTFLRFQTIPPSYIYNKSIKEIIGDIFNLKLKNLKVQLFLSPADERKARKMLMAYINPVVIHSHSRSSVNHFWNKEKWIELVQRLPEFTFIQLGLSDEWAIPGTIDLRGKTTLREAFALIKHSSSFVGIDSNFSHVTNAFDIPGVVLFGDSSPVFWGHDNNINIYKGVECSPCYYYLWRQECPYDHQCMNLISVEEVKEALITQVRKSKSKVLSNGVTTAPFQKV